MKHKKGGAKPMFTREFVNECLKQAGQEDPESMTERERFDAGMDIILKWKRRRNVQSDESKAL